MYASIAFEWNRSFISFGWHLQNHWAGKTKKWFTWIYIFHSKNYRSFFPCAQKTHTHSTIITDYWSFWRKKEKKTKLHCDFFTAFYFFLHFNCRPRHRSFALLKWSGCACACVASKCNILNTKRLPIIIKTAILSSQLHIQFVQFEIARFCLHFSCSRSSLLNIPYKWVRTHSILNTSQTRWNQRKTYTKILKYLNYSWKLIFHTDNAGSIQFRRNYIVEDAEKTIASCRTIHKTKSQIHKIAWIMIYCSFESVSKQWSYRIISEFIGCNRAGSFWEYHYHI